MTTKNQINNVAALISTLFLATSCLSQSPAEVVDKSQFSLQKSSTHQQAFASNKFNSASTDSNIIEMKSIEPIQPPSSASTPQPSSNQNSTTGYLVSRTKVTKDANQPKPEAKKEQQIVTSSSSKPSSQEQIAASPTEPTNTQYSEDLTYEEPENFSKPPAEVQKPIKPEFTVATPLNSPSFEWPVVGGKVLSRFGKIGNKFNEGISISAPTGSPVTAAGDGKVIYIGNNIEGYGNMIIIKHSGDYMTAYSHVQEILVDRGKPVKKGESIATVGQTGNVTLPQLHFSIRKGKKTINPESAG